MGLFSWIFRKDRTQHSFKDDDRELSLELRQQKAELRKIRNEIEIEKEKLKLEQTKEELEDLRERLGYYDEEEDDEETPDTPDKLITDLLTKAFQAKMGTATSTDNPNYTNIPTYNGNNGNNVRNEVNLSDIQIKEYLTHIPKGMIKKLKKMPDNELQATIQKQISNLSQDTLIRTIDAIKAL